MEALPTPEPEPERQLTEHFFLTVKVVEIPRAMHRVTRDTFNMPYDHALAWVENVVSVDFSPPEDISA